MLLLKIFLDQIAIRNQEKGDSFSQLFQEEIKIGSNAHLLTCKNVNSIQDIIDIEKCSCYKKLLRVTSWVFRCIRNTSKKKDKNLLPFISGDKLEKAKLFIMAAS